MKKTYKIFVSLLVIISFYACQEELMERPGSELPHEGNVCEVDLTYTNFSEPVEVPLKSTTNEDEIQHNYITTGYIVDIHELYNPETGMFEDKRFENVDLTDPQITFSAIGWFGIEVTHPEYDDRASGKKAYYIVNRKDMPVVEVGEYEIPLELDQVSVHLANGTGQIFDSQIYNASINGVKVEDYNVPVYVPKELDYVVSVLFRHSYEDVMVHNNGLAGQAFYHLVHDQTVDSGIEFELPTFKLPEKGEGIGN
ncbi:hypothetical protein [Carboxylicivirga marina]|uniref:hypothetical protein n=1 Tax=Carboxylicivirga marina TaxID=2800988 RepID=UPI0025990F10|nr:hypothetical protein [uncultured Carboxylicivirga sp.]